MLTSAHVLLYSDDAAATRAFFRDALGWPHVDDGDGWLIFKVPPTELGVHPTGPGGSPTSTAAFSFKCSDLDGTLAALRAAGAELLGEPVDRGYGVVATIRIPGPVELDVYEPHHRTAYDL